MGLGKGRRRIDGLRCGFGGEVVCIREGCLVELKTWLAFAFKCWTFVAVTVRQGLSTHCDLSNHSRGHAFPHAIEVLTFSMNWL